MLFGLVFFHVIGNAIWIFLNTAPPTWDAAFHTSLSIRMADYLATHIVSFDIFDFLTISNYYPPLTHLVGSLLALVSQYNYQAIQLTGTIFFALTLILLYFYVEQKLDDPRLAFYTTFFFSFYPVVFYESRQHMTDIPLTAMVLASLIALGKTNYLIDRKKTYLFFFLVSLALLTKWTAVIFIAIPFLWTLGRGIYNRVHIPTITKNILGGSLICLLTTGTWYVFNISNLILQAGFWSKGEVDDPQRLLSLENIFYYPKNILTFQIGFIGLVLTLLALITIKKKKTVLLEWLINIAIIYLVFTFGIGNKNIRFILPAMIYGAILMAIGINMLISSHNKLLRGTFYFIITWYVLAYSILSFGIPLKPTFKYALKFPLIEWVDLYYLDQDPVDMLFNRTNWQADLVARDVLNLTAKKDFSIYFINIEKPYFSASSFNIALYKRAGGLPANLQQLNTNFPALLKNGAKFPNEDTLKAYLEQADIIVIPEKSIGPKEAIRSYEVREQIQQYMLFSKHSFVLYRKFLLPDQDAVHLYVRPDLIEIK